MSVNISKNPKLSKFEISHFNYFCMFYNSFLITFSCSFDLTSCLHHKSDLHTVDVSAVTLDNIKHLRMLFLLNDKVYVEKHVYNLNNKVLIMFGSLLEFKN